MIRETCSICQEERESSVYSDGLIVCKLCAPRVALYLMSKQREPWYKRHMESLFFGGLMIALLVLYALTDVSALQYVLTGVR